MKKFAFLFFVSLFLPLSSLWAMARRPPDPETSSGQAPAAKLSLSLWDCYQMAVTRSETLAVQKEEVDRTLAAFLGASGEAIGDASFVMTNSFQDPQKGSGGGSSVGSTLTASERRGRQFTFSQPLFQGFKALGAFRGAGSLKKQKQGEWERARQLLFMDVTNAFYDYLKLDADIKIIRDIIDSLEDRMRDLEAWVDIGRSRPSEVASVRSSLEGAQANLARTQGDRAVAKNLLAFLIGIPVEPEELSEAGKELPPAEETADIFELVRERPDVEASRQAVKAAQGGLLAAQGDLWPEISIDGNMYEKREGFQSGISWDLLLTFDIPLGTGGTTLGKVRDSLSGWREAKLNYSLAERRAQREIRDAFDRFKSSLERYRFLQKASLSAEENFGYQQEEYRQRLVSNLDVLDALRSLFEAKRSANEAFYEVKKNHWQYEIAKGHCCSETPV